MELTDLVRKDLGNFKVVEMTEVYAIDTDGRKSKSVGFFRSEDIARGYIGTLADPHFHRTEKKAILTDGTIGFVIGPEIEILDDERGRLEIRQKAIAKLTPEECRVLGFLDDPNDDGK